MRNLILFASLLIFIGCAFSQGFPTGARIFYMTVWHTNKAYGSGAAFPADVWFNADLGLMRVDYRNPSTNLVFMKVFYNYTSRDKYEVCGNDCKRATFNSPAPIFRGESTTYRNPSACVTPDWPGPRACVSGCRTYVANPAQPQGIWSLSYNETSGTSSTLCLVRWSVATGQDFAPEWHVRSYFTGSFPNGSPNSASTYSSVISGVTCPQPTCFTVLDLALIVDESGSIWDANAWGDVQNFVLQLISSFTISTDRVRVGLAYFSGLDSCRQNWSVSSQSGVASDACLNSNGNGDCSKCGGRWNNLTPGGLVTSKSTVYKFAYDHNIQKGYTCISCGLDLGIKLVNIAPKANVQKMIILFTDGAQNRVTGTLKYQGDLAKSMGINVVAVATGGYKREDLEVFATPSNIYTSATFAGLTSLINQIVSPLCQPLQNIETCDFCSGLCSCGANCTCPNCDDFNACTNQRCSILPPPDGTLGVCTYTNVNCDDGNVCTQNLCNPSSGCSNPPVAAPTNPSNNYCRRWNCTNPEGFQYTDFGSTLCPQGSNKCIVTYCNSTFGTTNSLTGSCITRNMSQDFFYGESFTYTTSAGQTFTAQGCRKPLTGVPSCYKYVCNPVDGSCGIDKTSCVCETNADCNTDNNGCTDDVCDTALNRCNRTTRDCWSILSSGNCVTAQTAPGASNATGLGYWNDAITFTYQGSTNLPVVSASNTCDRLACYGGKRSEYTCSSTGPTTSTCVRSTIDCTSSGCVDNVCRTTGTWSNGQFVSNCGAQITRTCSDGSLCSSDNCRAGYTGTACTSTSCPMNNARCQFIDISNTCNDNNACTVNRCLNATGCDFTQTIPITANNPCYTYACNPISGEVRTVVPNACPPTGGDKCLIRYCNTTSLSCSAEWNKAARFTNEFTSFTDEFGVFQTHFGCLNTTALPLTCLTAKCNPTTGACFIDSVGCGCTDDAQCDDGNGCTLDDCNLAGQCVYTDFDCWSQLSGGGCTLTTPAGAINDQVGLNNYNLGSPINPPPNGLGPQKNCDEMSCHSGQRYRYVCQSTGSNQQQCNAIASNCTKGGCRDTICRVTGVWNNLQYENDCATEITPSCVSTGCNIRSCKTDFTYVYSPPPGTNNNANTGDNRCNVVNNATSCNDASLCTTDSCDDAQSGPQGGCQFTPIPNPFVTNFCFDTQCSPQSGWVRTAKTGICVSSDSCVVQYCNTTGAGQCALINKNSFAVGTTVSYVDSDGLTKTVTGCANPNPGDGFTCKQYGCNPSTGLCTLDISGCQCLTNSTCEDGSGCTIDRCIPPGNCQRTPIDCFSLHSDGGCTLLQTSGQAYSNVTGLTIYNNVYLTRGNPRNYADITLFNTATGLPDPANRPRSCAQLACYNGAPSNYTCSSTGENNFSCRRVYLNCSRNGCKDNVCQSFGTWNANNQLDANCGVEIKPNCADNNACTSDYCDVSWTPQKAASKRCRHDTLNGTSFCDDGNFCTEDYCDKLSTSGNVCKHRLYSNAYIKKYLCKKAKVCQTTQCTVNKCIYSYIGCTSPTLCVFFLCNGSTNETCKAYPTGVYKIDGCGVCAGNGLSCVPTTPGNPKKTSIAVALGVGLGIGLFFAFIIIGIITRTSYAAYLSLGTETLGSVTTSSVHQGNEHHLDCGDYNK